MSSSSQDARSAAQGREFCISCGEPVKGEWCSEPCHTDLRDSNNRVTCRRKHGVCNCPDCCGVRRSRATDPNLSDIPLHIRIAEDVQDARSAAYWTRKLSRRERVRLYLSWPYIRQTRLLCPLTEWWLNRG